MPHKFIFYRTRVAPTPSGYLHIGNALNFLLTAALAKRSGASLLLRIDDLDRERYRSAYARDIFDTLRFLNMQWQEGPQNLEEFEREWSQQCRSALYEEAFKSLKTRGAVFACTCSRTQSAACRCKGKAIPLDTPAAAWRVRTDERPVMIRLLDGNTVAATLAPSMKNFIVRKRDGSPSYQLTSLTDDLHFGIDLIVRGEDLWPSTIAQHFLAQQVGDDRFAAITFYHHPLLTTTSGDKLSKSEGASSVMHWREHGKTFSEFLIQLNSVLHRSLSVENFEELLSIFPIGTLS